MKKYATLSILQKKRLRDEILRRRQTHEALTCRLLSAWCQETFGLATTPGKSTIARIMQSASQPTEPAIGVSTKCRKKPGKHPALEHALFAWVCDQASLRRMVNGPIIREKARRLQTLCNEKLPQHGQISMSFSEGWLWNFKRRWGLRSFKVHGEGGDTDLNGAELAMPHLKDRISLYDARDVFNADECGLFYKLSPDRTVAQSRPLGRKKMKDRITVLVCANANGSEKFELMFIGTAAKPRPFKKKSGKEHGLDYHSNKKAWMTGALFSDWLVRFNASFSRQGRKVLLLIDNCSAHGKPETLPCLNNVEVLFLPPNTTAHIQPCDAGIIASMKVRYRMFQMERALELCEEEVSKEIYKVDVLSAMLAMKRIWDDLPQSSISNCWKHTGLLSPNNMPHTPAPERNNEETELMSVVQRLVPTPCRMRIEDLLHPTGEDDCIQVPDDGSLVEQVLATDEDEEIRSVEPDETISLPSIALQLRTIALCKRIGNEHGFSDVLRGPLLSLQRSLRFKQSNSAKQTTLEHLLK